MWVAWMSPLESESRIAAQLARGFGQFVLALGIGEVVFGHVADVSDVHDVPDFVAVAFQHAAQHIGEQEAAEVADVTIIPDGWTAVIKPGLALLHRAKLFDAAGECVAKLKHSVILCHKKTQKSQASFVPLCG